MNKHVRGLAVVALTVCFAISAFAETRVMGDARQVQEFVDKAAFDIPVGQLEGKNVFRLATACIDGRRPKGEKELPPELSIPGADEGILATILGVCNKLGLPLDLKEKMIERYIEKRGGLEKLRFHTDVHHEHDATGCGHFRLSKEKPAEYGLTAADIRLIEVNLERIGNKGKEILSGEHEECAVIAVNVENIGLRHQVGDSMMFVYNATLHRKLLGLLAEEFAVGFSLDLETLRRAFFEVNEKQLSVTVRTLALSKGLRVFSVERGRAGRLVVR